MTKPPKGVAQKYDRRPVYDRLMLTIPLQVYCPDLEQWARSWSYELRDIPPGLADGLECFKPFLRHLLTSGSVAPDLAPTPRQLVSSGRRDHPPTGGWTGDLRKQPIEQVVGDLIDDEGGLRRFPTASPRPSSAPSTRHAESFRASRRCREPPWPCAKPSTYDEPSEPLTAPCRPFGHVVRGQALQPRSVRAARRRV